MLLYMLLMCCYSMIFSLQAIVFLKLGAGGGKGLEVLQKYFKMQIKSFVFTLERMESWYLILPTSSSIAGIISEYHLCFRVDKLDLLGLAAVVYIQLFHISEVFRDHSVAFQKCLMCRVLWTASWQPVFSRLYFHFSFAWELLVFFPLIHNLHSFPSYLLQKMRR